MVVRIKKGQTHRREDRDRGEDVAACVLKDVALCVYITVLGKNKRKSGKSVSSSSK